MQKPKLGDRTKEQAKAGWPQQNELAYWLACRCAMRCWEKTPSGEKLVLVS